MATTFDPVGGDDDFLRFVGEFTSYERMVTFSYGADTLKLERMRAFAAALGDPHCSYPSIHVAGTKGKGTTCLLLEALLECSGELVGTYTSPHVEHVRERVRVGGQSIGEADLCETLNAMLPTLAALRDAGPDHFPTFFELMTGIAMAYFRTRDVDRGVFEVGLGGRLDATNILSPTATAITGIGLEHTRLLGSTLERIAREKAGIIKPGVPLVVGSLAPTARRAVLEVAAQRDAPVEEVARDAVRLTSAGRLRIAGFEGPFAPGVVRGPGLRADLAIALALWRRAVGREAARRDVIDAVLATVELPARVEVVPSAPAVVLDGAHTPESVRALKTALEEIRFPRPRRLILSVASDKQLDRILRALRGMADDFIVTRADPLRSVAPADIARRFAHVAGVEVPEANVIEQPREALARAVELGWPVVVTGSIYLAGALRRAAWALAGRQPAPRPGSGA